MATIYPPVFLNTLRFSKLTSSLLHVTHCATILIFFISHFSPYKILLTVTLSFITTLSISFIEIIPYYSIMSQDQNTINALTLQTANLNVCEPTLQLQQKETDNRPVLVGKFWGTKIFSPDLVEEVLSRSWRVTHGLSVSKDVSGIFTFFFNHEDDREKVWNGRPWCLSNNLLVLQRWSPDLALGDIDFTITPFWIHVSGLPANQISKHNASLIGGLFEELLSLDNRGSKDGDLCGIMRLRVMVKIDKPFGRGFFFPGANDKPSWIRFMYERMPDICFKCGKLGHYTYSCKFVPSIPSQPGVPDYGLWMRVDFSGRGKQQTFHGSYSPTFTLPKSLATVEGNTMETSPPLDGSGKKKMVINQWIDRNPKTAVNMKNRPLAAGYEVGGQKGIVIGSAKPNHVRLVADLNVPYVGKGKEKVGSSSLYLPVTSNLNQPKHPDFLKTCATLEALATNKPSIQNPTTYKKMPLDPCVFASSPNLSEGPPGGILCSSKILEELDILHMCLPKPIPESPNLISPYLVKDPTPVFSPEPSVNQHAELISPFSGTKKEETLHQGSSTLPMQSHVSGHIPPNPPLHARISDFLYLDTGHTQARYKLKSLARRSHLIRDVTTARAMTSITTEEGPLPDLGVLPAKRNRDEDANNEAKKLCVFLESKAVEGSNLNGLPDFK